MNISVVGLGYVGLSNAVLLAQHNKVTIVDIDESKIDMLNRKESPIDDKDIQHFLAHVNLDITATLFTPEVYKNADYVVIATPTDYDPDTNYFNTSTIETVIEEVIEQNPFATIVIKSTIPIGYTNSLKLKYETKHILFSPEFLREGKALEDNLYPSRIIMGEKSDKARVYAGLLVKGAKKSDIQVLFMGSTEAEAVKLFSNTYLAMRVAYFNELDTYSAIHNLNAREIINGVELDPRIGSHYNNPSFGYGGYCLPKDTKQLRANFADVPNDLIKAIVDSNKTRMSFISKSIIDKQPSKVGIYRLIMKADSDNYRSSAILSIIDELVKNNVEVVIYEPTLDKDYKGLKTIRDLEKFKRECDLIIANRIDNDIKDISNKIYTRDLFGNN